MDKRLKVGNKVHVDFLFGKWVICETHVNGHSNRYRVRKGYGQFHTVTEKHISPVN